MAPKVGTRAAATSTSRTRCSARGRSTSCFVPGFVSNINATLDPEQMPVVNAWAERIAGFGRLITFDKRGTGLSDRTVDVPGLEVRMDERVCRDGRRGVGSAPR